MSICLGCLIHYSLVSSVRRRADLTRLRSHSMTKACSSPLLPPPFHHPADFLSLGPFSILSLHASLSLSLVFHPMLEFSMTVFFALFHQVSVLFLNLFMCFYYFPSIFTFLYFFLLPPPSPSSSLFSPFLPPPCPSHGFLKPKMTVVSPNCQHLSPPRNGAYRVTMRRQSGLCRPLESVHFAQTSCPRQTYHLQP